MSPFGFANCNDPILDDRDLLNPAGCYEGGAHLGAQIWSNL